MLSYLDHIKSVLASPNAKQAAKIKRATEGIFKLKMLTPTSVHTDSTMANLSIQYRNEDYIGLQLMPVLTTTKLSDVYYIYNKRDRMAVPDDFVGARSRPNELTEHRSTANFSCRPHALMDFVDALTLENQDAPLNEMIDLTASVNDALDLNEEIRIANTMQTTGNYAVGNTVTNAGQTQWNSSGGGTPVADIQTGMGALWMGQGATKIKFWSSFETYLVLSRHPAILDLFKYTEKGVASPDMIAKFFGADEYLVGKARQDNANEGQTASYGRVWGKHFGITRVATSPGVRIACYGLTFRKGQKVTTQWYDQTVGVAGGYYSKTGLSETHNVVANDTGYFIQNAIA